MQKVLSDVRRIPTPETLGPLLEAGIQAFNKRSTSTSTAESEARLRDLPRAGWECTRHHILQTYDREAILAFQNQFGGLVITPEIEQRWS